MKRIAVAFSFALAVTGAYAGAWGDGSFENDDAMDWVNDCVHATSPGVLKVALARVLDADVVEAPDASAAIVAAEVVAASLGKASPAMPVNLKTWLAGQPGAQIAAQAALAQRALTKIEDPRHSELRQLWSEGKANQWLTKVQALRKRIGGKQAGAGHKQSLANDRFRAVWAARQESAEPASGRMSFWSSAAEGSGHAQYSPKRYQPSGDESMGATVCEST